MIKEIKKKMTRFGSIISYASNDLELEGMLRNVEHAANVTVHRVGDSNDKGFGQTVVGHKRVPKFKDVIGNYLMQIRGGELIAFLKPNTTILSDAERIYDFLDTNRLDRAFGFFIGDSSAPYGVILSGHLIEHLFHAIPDQLDMEGNWMGFLDDWLKNTLYGSRYFDANELISASITLKEVKPAADYPIVDISPEVPAEPQTKEVAPVSTPARRGPGRPKTKK